jgi:allantoin racemase
MRLLLINPNTTQSMTDKVVASARTFASPGTELVGATGRFGAAYVASRAAFAVAAHAALDAWAHATQTERFDAVVIACFGDPGLEALREIAPAPVVGMADAAVKIAAAGGARFGIVTGGERWGPMLEEFVAARRLSAQLAGVETVAPTGADIARDPDGSLALLAAACGRAAARGAQAVILGGAGLAGLTPRLQPMVDVALIDGVEAAVRTAEAAARGGERGASAGGRTVACVGVDPALATRLLG